MSWSSAARCKYSCFFNEWCPYDLSCLRVQLKLIVAPLRLFCQEKIWSEKVSVGRLAIGNFQAVSFSCYRDGLALRTVPMGSESGIVADCADDADFCGNGLNRDLWDLGICLDFIRVRLKDTGELLSSGLWCASFDSILVRLKGRHYLHIPT